MRHGSLRVRLAFWHAGLLAVTLVLLSVLTLLLLRSVLSSRADSALRDYAESTSRNIADRLYRSRAENRPEPTRFLGQDLAEWGRQIQVVDAHTDAVRDRSDGLASHRLPTDLDARVNALRGEITYQTRFDLAEHPVRIVTVPVMMGKNVPYLVQTAASLEGVDDALRRTSLILLILTPCVFIVALGGGWILVSRSLRPVDRMTRAALSMEPGKLGSRVEPDGADDEIARLAGAFNEMIARLEQSFKQIQQFSADASHELKTPLTAIRGEAEVALLDSSALDVDHYRTALRNIIQETERMSDIVENLLLLARADAKQLELKRAPLALDEIALATFESMEGLASRRGVRLLPGEFESVIVIGDKFWLGQIISNLVSNAVKYTVSGGEVTVSARVSTKDGVDYGTVVVKDTGPGISSEHLPHLFDRFYRVDQGRNRDIGGSGLGLNIALWAAQAHHGTITVNSEEGIGSEFTLWIPLWKEET